MDRVSETKCEKASKAAIIYELMTKSDAEWSGRSKNDLEIEFPFPSAGLWDALLHSTHSLAHHYRNRTEILSPPTRLSSRESRLNRSDVIFAHISLRVFDVGSEIGWRKCVCLMYRKINDWGKAESVSQSSFCNICKRNFKLKHFPTSIRKLRQSISWTQPGNLFSMDELDRKEKVKRSEIRMNYW